MEANKQNLASIYRSFLARLMSYLSGWQSPYLLSAALLLLHYQWVHDFEFVGDSVFLITNNKYMESLSYLWDNIIHNYFWCSAGYKVPYWRPVTKASWLIEYQFFGRWAGGYQWVQVAWFFAAIAGVIKLARDAGMALYLQLFIAAYLSISIIAIGPVTMVMARSDVVAVAGSVWAFLFWRQALAGDRWAYLLHSLFVVLALGSKEVSVYLLPLLFCWIVLLEPERRRQSRTYLSLAPLAVLTILYLYGRRQVLLQDEPEMAKLAITLDPLRIFASCSVYLQNLLPFKLTSTVRDIPFGEARSFAFIMTAFVTYAVALVLSLRFIKKRDPLALFLWFWLLLALSPVLLPAEIYVPGNVGRYNLADRWLFHALPAAALLWARWLQGASQAVPRRLVLLLCLLGCGGALSRSYYSFLDFKDELGFLKNEDELYYFSVPAAFRTEDDHCRYQDRQTVRALLLEQYHRVLQSSQTSWQRCGPNFERGLNWINAMLRFGLCEEAKPLAELLIDMHQTHAGVFPVHANLARRCVEYGEKSAKPETKQFWLNFQQGMTTTPKSIAP